MVRISKVNKIRRDEEAHAASKQRVKDIVKTVGATSLVLEMLKEVEAEGARLAGERREIDSLAGRKLDVPESIAELRNLFEREFERLATGSDSGPDPRSREFNRLLRKLVPEFHVYLVRLVDGGHLLPRAKVKLALDGLVPDAKHVPGLPELLTFERTIDLFHAPQRAKIRERAVELAGQKVEQREIAKQLGVTQTAVQKALALEKKMREMGLDSPYILVTQPPNDYAKLRRHKNKKYKFEPVEGYEPPPL